jgi:hypothetical protein
MNTSEFTCICGKSKTWITEGQETEKCPECGRKYIVVYDEKNFKLKAEEIKDLKITRQMFEGKEFCCEMISNKKKKLSVCFSDGSHFFKVESLEKNKELKTQSFGKAIREFNED